MRVLVDTCVIVDALQDRKPFSENAKIIFYAVANKQIDGYISAKAITDIYYLAHRATHGDESTRQILKTLLGLFDILDTTAIDCRKALSSEHRPDGQKTKASRTFHPPSAQRHPTIWNP